MNKQKKKKPSLKDLIELCKTHEQLVQSYETLIENKESPQLMIDMYLEKISELETRIVRDLKARHGV